MQDQTPEQSAAQMEAWGQWISKLGPALTDVGAAFGQRVAVADSGTTRDAGDLNGYSVVEAESLAAARSLTDNHPFLTDGKGRFQIDVFELIPM